MKLSKSSFSLTIIFAVLMIFTGSGLDLELNSEVIGVKVSVKPSNFTGNCPKLFVFTGGITLKMDRKGGEYRYRWIRSDGVFGPVKGGTIKRNGSVVVRSEWLFGGEGTHWQQIQILPPKYKINSNHGFIKPIMASNKAHFTLNCTEGVIKNPDRNNLTINNNVSRVILPVWEISGLISPKPDGCGGCLEGRKIRIILRREARDGNPVKVTRHVYTLDRNSSYHYKFRSPFVSAGTYTIIVEKGPTAQSNHSNNLNICFTAADPLRRTVTLTSTNKKALNQDFKIDYSIIWGGSQTLCW